MNLTRKIIINADDFGHTPGVTRGIINAYKYGIITSTSALGNLLVGNESLKSVRSNLIKKPPLGIGVHLNITFVPPLLPYEFYGQPFDRPFRNSDLPDEWQDKAWKPFFLLYREKSVMKEFVAQIERVEKILGKIDHLDSHNSSASYKPIDKVYVEIAAKLKLPVRPAAPLTNNPIFGGDLNVDHAFIKKIRSMGIKTVDKADLSYYYQKKHPYEDFKRSLRQIKPGEVKEYMFHPSDDDSMGKWRLFDMEFVTSKKTIKIIKESGVELTTYGLSAH